MKKITAMIVVLCFIISSFPNNIVFADTADASTVLMTELPKTNFFNTEGTLHNKEAYEKWLQTALPEVLTMNILKGNYAFVEDCDYYWNVDHKEKSLKAATRNESEQQVVKSEIANKLFGTRFTKPYVTPDEICSVASSFESFTDPRGFIFFSKNVSKYINTDIINAENRQYKSYYDVALCIGEITWEDIEPTEQDWETARKRILSELTFIPGTEDEYGDYIDDIINSGKELLKKIDPSPTSEKPFLDTDLTNCIGYTRNLARCYYVLKITDRNDIERKELLSVIETCLDKLFKNFIGKNIQLDSNWFLNLITDPQMLALALLYTREDLPKEKINEWVNILFIRCGAPMMTAYVVPYKQILYLGNNWTDVNNPYADGTNLFWRTFTICELCLIVENQDRMNHCLKYLNLMFDEPTKSGYVKLPTPTNGFYEDGSFIYHGNFAYNFGYGNSLLCNFADAQNVFAGTAFDLKKVYGFNKIYNWIEWGWIPFLYSNNMIKRVQGRENPYGRGANGNSPVKSIMLLAINSNNEPIKEKIAKLLKPLVDESYKELKNAKAASTFPNMDYPALNTYVGDYLDYIHDMPSVATEPYNHAYYNMDMFLHKRNDYTFALAMSSERVGKFEAINDAGYSDWYTGDGMTYTLKGNAQYIQRWWQYVDKYCIPGTTVGTNERRVGSVNYYANIEANNSWAGGASDGNLGVAAMVYPTVSNNPKNVKATKSYFMTEDKIICLGTGITAENDSAYTTVENFISYEKPEGIENPLYERGYVKTVVDGEEIPYKFDEKIIKENPKWAFIDDNRGFLFIGDNRVSVERCAKDKRFCGNAGTEFDTEAYNFPFVTIKVEHGENPQNARYGYVILPNKTEEETKALAENPGFEIIEQSERMHAVKLSDGTILANVFEPTKIEEFTFLNPCSAIIRKENDGYRVFVQDPTQKLKTIRFIVPEGKNISGQFVTSDKNTAIVDVITNYGRTYEVLCGLKGDSAEAVVSEKIEVRNINIAVASPNASTRLYAKHIDGKNIRFVISSMPENGICSIAGDRLYYTAPKVKETEKESVLIKAYDEEGNASEFKVTFLLK